MQKTGDTHAQDIVISLGAVVNEFPKVTCLMSSRWSTQTVNTHAHPRVGRPLRFIQLEPITDWLQLLADKDHTDWKTIEQDDTLSAMARVGALCGCHPRALEAIVKARDEKVWSSPVMIVLQRFLACLIPVLMEEVDSDHFGREDAFWWLCICMLVFPRLVIHI